MKTVRYLNAAARAAASGSGVAGSAAATGVVAAVDSGSASAGGWEPRTWLGAPAPGGLALPPAHPSASWMYAPRGVFLGRYRGRDVLVAADTGNHRVMIWHSLPYRDEQPCDVVLGQPDFQSEGPAAGRGDTRLGMNLPTGVLVHDDLLIVADAWHHRVLIYRGLPESTGAEPDLILGQDGPGGVEPNRGGSCGPDTFYWPFGVAVVGGRFYVADTGNRRILGWSGGVPSSATVLPDLILGQPDAFSREENRGGPPGAASFRWPHAICGTWDALLVADAGNHRLLGWRPHPDKDADAGLVLGQPGFDTAIEMPYSPQNGNVLRFPYSADTSASAASADTGETMLAVADTANNRVLFWEDVPTADNRAPDAVLGQPDFTANGENRWTGVTRDSLCWPYGLSLHSNPLYGDRLAVADSGNNRVVIWGRS